MEFLVGWVAFAILGAIIAGAKGHNAIGFFFLGLVLSPLLSIIAALVVKPNRKYLDAEALGKGEARKCPFCAELIRPEAKVCRYCSRELPELPVAPAPAPKPAPKGLRWIG